VLAQFIIAFGTANAQHDSIYLWYGNLTDDPLNVHINEHVPVYLYFMGQEDVWVADCYICLGADTLVVDSLLSHVEGEFYYPLTEWDYAWFDPPEDTVQGLPPGWANQSFFGFVGWAHIWLHYEVPTCIVRYVLKTANDSTLVGEEVTAIGPGVGRWGPTVFGDTIGRLPPPLECFSPFRFLGGGYIEGHVTNQSGEPLANTVITNLNTSRHATTDTAGFYHMALYPGSHSFTFTHQGYVDTTVTGIAVIVDSVTQLDMVMRLITSVDESASALPGEFKLLQNYPNPFNATTRIEYSIPKPALVNIKIYDVVGRLVTVILSENRQAGFHGVFWDRSNVPSGIYFYRLQAGDFSSARSMLLLR